MSCTIIQWLESSTERLSLSFSPQRLQHPNHAVVADSLQYESHAVAALAKLVERLGRSDALDAPLDALSTPSTDNSGYETTLLVSLSKFSSDLFAQSRPEYHRRGHVGLARHVLDRKFEILLLDDGENTSEIEVSTFRLHPSLFDVDDTRLQNVRSFVATVATCDTAREHFENGAWHATLLQVNPGGVEPLCLGVDMAGDGIGAQDMGGEGIELGGGVAEEVGESDGGKRVRILMSGGMRENHCHRRVL